MLLLLTARNYCDDIKFVNFGGVLICTLAHNWSTNCCY